MRSIAGSQGRLLLFDNLFFRKLITKPRYPEERQWQEFFFEKINKEFVPCAWLTTPFLFLEMIGLGAPPRCLTSYQIDHSIRSLPRHEWGWAVSKHWERLFDRVRGHYANMPDLSKHSLKTKCREFISTHVADNNFARFLADDVLVRFTRDKGFEGTVHEYLAVDELQLHLVKASEDQIFILAQIQFLKDLIYCFAHGMNVPIFRLLRSMWCSMEPQWLKRGQETFLPFKSYGDLVDNDYCTYTCLGAHSDEKLRTVTLFTCDPVETVEKRLKVSKFLFELASSGILVDKVGCELPELRQGHVYVCDSKEPVVKAVLRVKELVFDLTLPEEAVVSGCANEIEKVI